MDEGAATEDIMRAPALRVRLRWMTFALVAGVALDIASRTWWFPWLRGYLAQAHGSEAFRRFAVTMAVFGAATFALAFWLFRRGLCIRRLERMPLPGTFVLRDTPVGRGAVARRAGVLIMGCAILIAGGGLSLALIPWFVVPH
jgi:hypothetical protein